MRGRPIDRERIAGNIIFISLFVILFSVIAIRLLDVKVSNIELIDQGLYTVITDNGPINIGQNDVLRIERTYPKAAITGTTVELNRIYTNKGFIYFSSSDPFYKTGHQLINSLDFEGKPVWFRSYNGTGSEKTQNQLLNDNFRAVQPFNYAIGTPPERLPVVFSVMALQYLALAIGGIALLILIFPLRLDPPTLGQPFVQQDTEYCSSEEQLGVVAK